MSINSRGCGDFGVVTKFLVTTVEVVNARKDFDLPFAMAVFCAGEILHQFGIWLFLRHFANEREIEEVCDSIREECQLNTDVLVELVIKRDIGSPMPIINSQDANDYHC